MKKVKYKCKENDNKIIFKLDRTDYGTWDENLMKNEIDEVWFGNKETGFVVIGFNDLENALKKVKNKINK